MKENLTNKRITVNIADLNDFRFAKEIFRKLIEVK